MESKSREFRGPPFSYQKKTKEKQDHNNRETSHNQNKVLNYYLDLERTKLEGGR